MREQTPITECLLIADDLTGACDAAVHFAARGYTTRVFLGLQDAPAEVQAWSTETRDAEPPEIRARIAELARCVPARETCMIFKKIDSTLRGSGAVEIAAAVEAFHCDAAVITPSLPAQGRVVEGGWLRVLHDPAFAPVSVSDWLGVSCAPVAPAKVASAIHAGARWIPVDASSDGDLDCIAAQARAPGRRILWAGSAGLAAALARTFPKREAARSLTVAALCDAGSRGAGRRTGPVVFAIGSDHPATLAQQAALREAAPDPTILAIPRGGSPECARKAILDARPAALFLCGGDTAAFVCRALGVESIGLQAEILPGIPVGTIHGGDLDGLPIITKSGGFGGPRAFIEIADYFECPKY
jgi:D-threonate/D-erythronate kinase